MTTPSTSATAGFVHLHVHTEFSEIDSLLKVKDLVAAVVKDGNRAAAASDHGTLGGIWKLGLACAKAGVKAIPAMEAYLAIGSRYEHNTMPAMDDDVDPDTDSDSNEDTSIERGAKAKKYEHLTLVAISRKGWENLVTMQNEAHNSYWHKPRIDYDLLAQYGEGIIVLTGCLGGPVAGQLARGDRPAAIANLHKLIAAVGKDNVYVEVMDHDIPAQLRIMDDLRSVAAEVGVGVVATNDAHYLRADQHDAHEAWLAVGTKKVLADTKRFKFHGTGHHLRTEAEMRALQGGADWWQDACDTTVAIAARVADDVLPAPRLRLPKYPLPDGYTDAGTYLKDLVRKGAFERYGHDPERPGFLPPAVNAQLKFEFGVVHPAGLDDYFLITWDVICWARSDRGLPTDEFPLGEPGQKKPIRVGPGRGSAAGSAISYCLYIVGVDPLKHGLLFERFLNPQRTGMPDIDVDFEQIRRPEVLRYIERRFGRDRVARIGTFGVAATRAAIKDAARVTSAGWLGTKLSPLVPIGANGKPVSLATLADVTDKSGEAFRNAVTDAGAPAQAVLGLARAFENVTKRQGIHACGTLIADEPMAPLVPLRRDRAKGATDEDLLVTVWDGKDVDGYGLLKMDVLGLRNLDVISAAVDFIAQTTGELVDPDALTPGDPTDAVRDGKAWELISSGRTAGVFQLESSGITALAEKVAPNSLADLTALVALYRPGPMAAKMHDRYAARKNGHETVDYEYLTADPAEQAVIASVLNTTYGVVAYQEQLMSLGGAVGGLDPGMRNKLQKAFSKKDASMMADVKDAFIAGGLAGAGPAGVAFSTATLDRLWVTFEGSAAYLFNASHACAYGFVSYQTAYLKANWPVQYGAALLSVTDDDEKRLAVITSLHAEGITILAPDINASGATTRPDGDVVRLGLSEVKGVGANAVHLVAERELNGPFTGVADALGRCRIPAVDKHGNPSTSSMPVNTVEALIEAGAFDAFGPRKGQAMIVRAAKVYPTIGIVDAEWGVLERAARQRDRLGLITGTHPLKALKDQIGVFRDAVVQHGKTLTSVQAVGQSTNGDRLMILGVLAGWGERAYSKGRMAALTLEGSLGSVEGVMWDEDRARLAATPTVGDLVLVTAQVRVRLVETERTDDDGETVVESFERRDLTVKKVDIVPVEDPCIIVHPVLGELVLPEYVPPVVSRRAVSAAPAGTGTVELAYPVDLQSPPPFDEGSAAPRDPDLDSFGQWDEPIAVFEPPTRNDHLAPEPGNYDPEPDPNRTRHLSVVPPLATAPPVDLNVIELDGRGRLKALLEHPVLRTAALDFDLPDRFANPAGGVWVLRAADGTQYLVNVGGHTHGAAAHLQAQGPGWTAVPAPQSAAA